MSVNSQSLSDKEQVEATESEDDDEENDNDNDNEEEDEEPDADDDDDDDDEGMKGEEEGGDDDDDEEETSKIKKKKSTPPSTSTKNKKKKTVSVASSSASSPSTSLDKNSKKKKKSTTTTTSSSNSPSTGGAKSSSASSSSSSSTPYTQLIQDAIVAMKDRTGSSQPAIQKWIVLNHPTIDLQKFKQRFLLTLKNGVKSKRFIKIKSSYKMSSDFINKSKKKKQQAAAAAKKKKKLATMATKAKAAASAAAAAKPVIIKQLTKAELAAMLEKERREAKEKERLDKIRKRKFPMEDLRLIEEDKELDVSITLPTRPVLQLAIPDIPLACKSDTTGNGILDDIFHIYHFFMGDVGWGRWPKQANTVVAPFTLDQLLHCVQLIMKGWSKKAKMVPPLLSHLFVVTLQHLVPEKLVVALTPASWSEVLLLYMDAMERYCTSDASEGSNVIQSVGIDLEYLFYISNERRDTELLPLPTLSDPFYLQGNLEKAHAKLLTKDPWELSADELLSLLKALVDDVIGTNPDCSDEFDTRLEDTYELLKRKRTADATYRKLLIAHNKEVAEETKERSTSSSSNGPTAPQSDGGSGDDTNDNKVSNNNNTTPSKGGNNAATTTTTRKAKMREVQLEKARKEQQKANDNYEKACGGKLLRTGPIGFDRNYNEVYHAWNDPERLFVLQRGKIIPRSNHSTATPPPSVVSSSNHLDIVPQQLQQQPPDDVYKLTWHSIDKRSILEKYVESLDVRGTREQNLYEALQPIKRLVYDDIKEMNARKALLKEKNDVKRRLENARLKFETGRKSGRLVAQSEQELFDLQDEIERLERSVEEGDIVQEYDMEVTTGLQMLRTFDDQEAQVQRRRASRRDTQKRQKVDEHQQQDSVVPKLPCSHLWPTGHIDGTGIVGLIVNLLLELEERVERLVKWENGDRKAWIANLETAIHAWNEGTVPFLLLGTATTTTTTTTTTAAGETTTTTGGRNGDGSTMSPNGTNNKNSNIRMSITPGSTTSSSQLSTPMTPYQVLSMMKQPLLDLESRVFEASGLAMAAKDADEADDNMSTSPEDEEEQIKFAWKKLIHRLKRLPAKANAKIRQCVIEGIAAARKAHNNVVVAQLREALLQYHPEAAGLCKTTALEVLVEHGDYDDQDDDDDEEDDDDDKDDVVEEDRESATKTQTAESGIASVLCAEAVTLISSLDGQEDASRQDWISAVKKTKTISKMAALVSAFCNNAAAKLEKMESEQVALSDVMAAWGTSDSSRKKKGYQYAIGEPSEVWANVDFSDEFCLVKVDTYPWWPARKCSPKDATLASQLQSLGRVFVSLIGESGGLRVVKEDALLPFSETLPPDEDLGSQPREIRNQLDDCMAMARRIVRGKLKKKTSKGKKVSLNGSKTNCTKDVAANGITKD